MSGNTDKFLTISEIQKRYDVCRATVWLWRRDGRLPPPIGAGRKPQWRLSDLIAFENRQPENV
ncbi:helix-turn-helix domain-containing protein [Sinorhizobium chiapasense]